MKKQEFIKNSLEILNIPQETRSGSASSLISTGYREAGWNASSASNFTKKYFSEKKPNERIISYLYRVFKVNECTNCKEILDLGMFSKSSTECAECSTKEYIIREISSEELKLWPTTGYLYFIDKNHPLRTGNASTVYYHRHVISCYIGRWITSDEVVHHKDENKLNNSIENLELCTRSSHAKLHKPSIESINCIGCGKEFKPLSKKRKYCSSQCSSGSKLLHKSLTKEELEPLVWELGFTELAKIYGMSDNGIKKRAVSLGCIMPPPYFHNKIKKKDKRLEAYKIASNC